MNSGTVGIDGCMAGWLAVSMDKEQAGWRLVTTAGELRDIFERCKCCFIDIPIGLEEDRPVRTCDDLLRRVLGAAYRSSVFSPPVRAALLTGDYSAASDINEAKTGKRISIQAWNITPKIQMVDHILQANKNLSCHVLESHPELLFKKLTRGSGPLDRKKTKTGIEQRLELLRNADARSAALFDEMRTSLKKNQAADDDLLDALVLALAASKTAEKPIRTLPMPAETDCTGLSMAIHFT